MKKIGIITHHAAHNYGAMLQAYALQRYIRNNIEAKVLEIDFVTKEMKKAYAIFQKPRKLRGYIRQIQTIMRYPELKKKHNSFVEFYNEFIDKTKRYETYLELADNPPKFDIYITGSDQVFSPLDKELRAKYLDFGTSNTKRVAYAPSFGYSYVPDDKKETIRQLLEKFDHLSSREISGCNIIKDIIGKEVPNVLDPVFLLDPEDYREIANPAKLKYKKFILCYSLVGIEKQIALATKIKMLTGLPIVLLRSSALMPVKEVDKIIRSAGPREFLWLFDHASYIVTDSFHGNAFSLVFQKDFFSTIAFPEKSERIYSLLGETSLKSRIVDNPNEINSENLSIDYKTANEKIQDKRKVSMDYLEEALQ